MASDPEAGHASLAPLSRGECLELLRRGSIGRLALVVDGEIHILPLNYAADDEGTVVFRTADLTAASNASLSKVAFEIDEIDQVRHGGLSVAVHGLAREITDAVDDESQRLRELPVHPWASGRRDRWFKITPKQITGRRLGTTSV